MQLPPNNRRHLGAMGYLYGMAILRFRIYWEEDESVYRDILIKHTQKFTELHSAILKSWEFDSKHQATFFRSNDNWQRGREISLEKYDKKYKVDPLLMEEVVIGTEVKSPNQRFIYEYDFIKGWEFHVELIKVEKESDHSQDLPSVIRVEGLGPSQYGAQSLVDKRLAELEEKYDLNSKDMDEGYGSEGEDDASEADEENGAEESYGEDEY